MFFKFSSFAVTVVLSASVLAQSTTFVFDDSRTAEQYASISWSPSTVLDGVQSGCMNYTTETTCQGTWWTEKNGQDYNSTVHSTYGPSVSVNFSFVGDSVTAYFLQYNNGANATYSLDGAAPVSFTTYTSEPVWKYQQPLVNLTQLVPGPHSLVISYDNSSYGTTMGRSWLVVDLFTYTVPSSLITGTLSDPADAKAPLPSPTVISETVSATTLASNSETTHHESLTPVIIGASLGGAAALFLVLGGALFYLRRREYRGVPVDMEPAFPNRGWTYQNLG